MNPSHCAKLLNVKEHHCSFEHAFFQKTCLGGYTSTLYPHIFGSMYDAVLCALWYMLCVLFVLSILCCAVRVVQVVNSVSIVNAVLCMLCMLCVLCLLRVLCYPCYPCCACCACCACVLCMLCVLCVLCLQAILTNGTCRQLFRITVFYKKTLGGRGIDQRTQRLG